MKQCNINTFVKSILPTYQFYFINAMPQWAAEWHNTRILGQSWGKLQVMRLVVALNLCSEVGKITSDLLFVTLLSEWI